MSNLWWRIAISVPFWIARLAILLALAIPGLLIVYLLASQAWCWPTYSKRFDRMLLQFPRIAWPWCNYEDGVDGLRGGDPAQQWWADKTAGWSPVRRIFVWSALRNPVDSLRWVPLLNPKLDPERVRFIGMDHEPAKGESGWYFAWLQGTPYSCIRVERFGFRLWCGWKLKPDDSRGLQPGDARAIRCDFALQLKRVAR
jgi:hypothetical protein